MVMPLVLLSAMVAAPPAITPRELVATAGLSSLTVSPDHRWVAVRIDRADVAADRVDTQWIAISTRDGARRDLGSGGMALFNGAGGVAAETPVWAPDSRALYVRIAQSDGVQVWRLRLDGGAPEQVTDDPGDIASFRLSEGGRTLVYRAGAPRAALGAEAAAERDAGVRVDAHIDLMVGASSGGRYLGQDVPVRTTGHWFERTPMPDPTGPDRTIALSNPGAITAPMADLPPIALDAALRRASCGAGGCGGDFIVAAAHNGGDVIVTRQAPSGDQSLWRAGRGGPHRLVQARGDIGGASMPCAFAGRAAYCVASSADEPPALVRFDLDRGRRTVLLDPNAALRARTSGRVTRLAVRAGGLDTQGFLVRPRGDPPAGGWPLVISYYRCDGFLRGGVGDELPIWPLADQGVAVLCLNAASVPASATHKIDELEAARLLVGDAIDRLAAGHLIAPARVGMHGLSFGSEVTLWVAGHSNLLAAAAIASGQLEPAMYWTYAVPGRDAPDMLRQFWGLRDPDTDRADWDRLSPAHWADRIQAPLLMQLPEAEARWSVELTSKLARSRPPMELYVFPGASHVKSAPRQKLAAYTRNLDWFRFWLADAIDPAPDKAEQYARWRGLAARMRQASMSSTQSSASVNSSSRK